MKLGARQLEISLDGVGKTYPGGVVGVERVDLQVDAGELVALVGASGCGKSTTLRVVAGLEEATCGQVRLGGREVTRWAPHRRRVALLAQRPVLNPRWTVGRHLEFAWALRHGPRWGSWRWCRQAWRGVAADAAFRRRRAEVAEAWEIEPLLSRRAGDLSGGEQQQAALARAMMGDPDAYLLDEPFSALDVARRLRLRWRLKEWQRRVGRPVLYVTHDRGEALALGDRVAVMCAGRVAQCGSPRDVFCRPATRRVAETLTSSGLNRLDATLRSEAADVVLRAADSTVRGQGAARDLLVRWQAAGRTQIDCAVRSEDLNVVRVGAARAPDDGDLFAASGRVIGVERQGEADFVRVRLGFSCGLAADATRGGEPSVWTARVGAWSDWREGDEVELCWHPSRFLVFDSASGENLSR